MKKKPGKKKAKGPNIFIGPDGRPTQGGKGKKKGKKGKRRGPPPPPFEGIPEPDPYTGQPPVYNFFLPPSDQGYTPQGTMTPYEPPPPQNAPVTVTDRSRLDLANQVQNLA